ncbi:hypothetical protein [Pedosphaera parvula]|nr:hypothetical protein [Pedosphaera parvula]
MNDSFQKTYDQASAFQKIWMDSFTKLVQAGSIGLTPGTPPPESLRQLRGSIFNALSESWEDYMRSPQFKESMKTMMDNAIAFRKANNDFFTQAQHAVQGTAREDIDNVLAAIRQAEDRVLNRLEAMAERLEQLEGKVAGAVQNGNPKVSRGAAARKPKATAKKVQTKSK